MFAEFTDVTSIEKGQVPRRGNGTMHPALGAGAANLQTNPVDTYGGVVG